MRIDRTQTSANSESHRLSSFVFRCQPAAGHRRRRPAEVTRRRRRAATLDGVSTAIEQQPQHRRLLVALVAGVLAIVVGIVVGIGVGVDAHASTAGGPVPGTRVAAIHTDTDAVVASSSDVLPGDRRARAPDYDQIASGSSVAAEAGAEATGGVCGLRDAVSGLIARTGRTLDLQRRFGEHGRDPCSKDLKPEVLYRTDDRPAQRGLEQIAYDANPSSWLRNGGLNRIRPIAEANRNIGVYVEAARQFLRRAGGGPPTAGAG